MRQPIAISAPAAWTELRRLCVILVGLSLSVGVRSLSGQTGEEWDVTQARGETRLIDFTTSEGTWTSVDISPDGTWLVFDLLGHIYRLPISGGQAEILTQNTGVALNFHPRISPDGREIAFVSDRAGQQNLWVMNADGSDPRPIFLDLNSQVSEPAWTPEGHHILAVRQFSTTVGMLRRSARIWIFPREGGEGRELIGSRVVQHYWPSPAPDGEMLYYHVAFRANTLGSAQGSHHLRRLHIPSGRVENVTPPKRVVTMSGNHHPPELLEVAPEVSPDGRWLAFARRIPGGRISYRGHEFRMRTALWLRDLRTGAERVVMDPITTDATEVHSMHNFRILPGYSWAKDSRSIVIAEGGKLRRLWIDTGRVETIPYTALVRREISEMPRSAVAITDEPFEVRFAQWPTSSPDGRRLAFVAVGRIWLKDLPNGRSRPLTRGGDGPFELSPAWSPDGRWVAYATWDDFERGHVWKVPASGGRPQRLTEEPGEYLHPVWTPDGTAVVVSRGSGATARQERRGGTAGATDVWGANLHYDIVRLPAAGGAADFIARTSQPVKVSFGADGRLHFPEAVGFTGNPATVIMQEPPEVKTVLRSIRLDASEPRDVASFRYGHEAVISPDGGWAAFREGHNIYLATLQGVSTGDPPPHFDKESAGTRVQRLTLDGGMYPRWRSATKLEYMGGNQYHVHDVSTGRTDTVSIGLRVPRRIPQGVLALTGARIVTLEGDDVIEDGTLVVHGSRIACVGDCALNGADRVIDVSGTTIIPGFVDVHAHHLREAAGVIPQRRPGSALFLAYGVTTTIDPATSSETAFPIKELVDAGRLVGPRSYSVGENVIDWADHDKIREYVDAERNVRRRVNWGAVSIKDYRQTHRAQSQMLTEAGRRLGVTITAEGGAPLHDLALIMDGHTGFEHAIMLGPVFSDITRFFGMAGATYSATVTVAGVYPWSEEYFLARHDLMADEKHRRFLPWRELQQTRYAVRPIEEYSFPYVAEATADVIRAGGHGTIGGHGEQPGIGSHWEVWMHATASTPLEALRIATTGGAQFVGLDDDLGTITVGKLADFMVLNANPLEDIRSTLAIRFVAKGGVLYDADTLDEIWPEARPYGPVPWIDEDALRTDVRAVGHWDSNTNAYAAEPSQRPGTN